MIRAAGAKPPKRGRVLHVQREITHVQNSRPAASSCSRAGVTGAATIAMPQVSRAQTTTLKMQTSWPATDIFTEMAQAVHHARQRHGGRPAQDRPAAWRRRGASVPGVRRRQWRPDRRRPYGDRVLVRQAQGRLAVRHRPGVRLQRQRGSRLDPLRRRQGAVRRAPDPDHEGQHQELLRHADADPAARLVQEAGDQGRGHEGPEVPHRRSRGRPDAGHGRSRSRSFRAAKSCRPWSAA